MPYPARPIEERFWEKVNKTGSCWLWTAALHSNGYGTFSVRKGKFIVAHRMAYMLTKGDIPDGQIVHHTCNNPACVNPIHLVTATQRENVVVYSTASRSAIHARKTHCPKGHAYDAIGRGRSGSFRRCKTCERHHRHIKRPPLYLKQPCDLCVAEPPFQSQSDAQRKANLQPH